MSVEEHIDMAAEHERYAAAFLPGDSRHLTWLFRAGLEFMAAGDALAAEFHPDTPNAHDVLDRAYWLYREAVARFKDAYSDPDIIDRVAATADRLAAAAAQIKERDLRAHERATMQAEHAARLERAARVGAPPSA